MIATTAQNAIATLWNVYRDDSHASYTQPASCTKIAATAKDAITTPDNVYGYDSHTSYDSAHLSHEVQNDGKGRRRHLRAFYFNLATHH
ncbi:hypothetical protein M407DRAFT_30428 [Tulasnella calospora MUT 4182]|uniref:Uncharacterized protein n=1 Tax=Tulasnella calospora MUT 4182 TaxID=1051891 RepID=A0A0C3KEN3_9AGAM|nr:hypothetical protein M407DRAFT_30428 [Tulasnella calospora MUT 4182]